MIYHICHEQVLNSTVFFVFIVLVILKGDIYILKNLLI